jgi:hypothetical protein
MTTPAYHFHPNTGDHRLGPPVDCIDCGKPLNDLASYAVSRSGPGFFYHCPECGAKQVAALEEGTKTVTDDEHLAREDADPRDRLLYLIVANEGRFAMIYCASPGLDGRIRQGYSQYFHADSEVFILGPAAANIPSGKFGLIQEFPGYMLNALRGVEDDPAEGERVLSDQPGSKHYTGKKAGPKKKAKPKVKGPDEETTSDTVA